MTKMDPSKKKKPFSAKVDPAILDAMHAIAADVTAETNVPVSVSQVAGLLLKESPRCQKKLAEMAAA